MKRRSRWETACGNAFCPVAQWLRLRALAFLSLITSLAATAEGIPEPSMVMYGIVADAQGKRQTNGTLVVNIQPPGGGASIRFEATLSNINDQFSYVLVIPCETEITGFPVTGADRLKLLATPLQYDRAAVTFNGAKILYVNPSQSVLNITSKDRGRLERIDFSPAGGSDTDTNGLLKSWELQYFGRLGVDPTADPDGDGMSNMAEMLAGTNPTDKQSRFAFVSVAPALTGGVQVAWSSELNRTYRVFRSTDLLTGFVPIGPAQIAQPPANSYVDASATGNGPYFYLVKVVGP